MYKMEYTHVDVQKYENTKNELHFANLLIASMKGDLDKKNAELNNKIYGCHNCCQVEMVNEKFCDEIDTLKKKLEEAHAKINELTHTKCPNCVSNKRMCDDLNRRLNSLNKESRDNIEKIVKHRGQSYEQRIKELEDQNDKLSKDLKLRDELQQKESKKMSYYIDLSKHHHERVGEIHLRLKRIQGYIELNDKCPLIEDY